nr:hypothetical protein [Tanacetum cinerariifolium]
MTTVNQGMSVEEIERVVAKRVANAIEAITIYETKTNLSRIKGTTGEIVRSKRTRRVVHAFGGGETEQDLNNIEDEIEA